MRFLPLCALLFGVAYAAAALFAPPEASDYDLIGFGALPVLANGRIKPLDSVARTSLLALQGRQRVSAPENSDPLVGTPTEWIADVFFAPARADSFPTFRIDSPEVLALLGIAESDTEIRYGSFSKRVMAVLGMLPSRTTRFSYDRLLPKLDDMDRQARLADGVEAPLRTPFQRQVLAMRDHVVLYLRLRASLQTPDVSDFAGELGKFEAALPAGILAIAAKQKGELHDEGAVVAMSQMANRFGFMEQMAYLRPIPTVSERPGAGQWESAGTELMKSFETGRVSPEVLSYAMLGRAWRERDPSAFNRIVHALQQELGARYPVEMAKGRVELRFNRSQPFYVSTVLYVTAFILAALSWLKYPQALGRAAFWLVLVAWLVATAGIVTRMWLEGRPPVTNLYSSALFVGWGAVALCMVIEHLYRNAVGSAAAGMIGFATLLIAHNLALGSDTLEMMRAVLDSNFWLATHVVVVTLGYASTFLSGFLALIYIIRGLFTRSLDQATADSLTRMVYGIVCFATLFSFVGTVLGGIWADQSWGRFWGWDPKENGALLIVVWNAIILHARWSGMVRSRGLMVMAVFGNVVTSWSWFGVNMLGVGLHSYGFMDEAFYWLNGFVVSQLMIIAVALQPLQRWRSFGSRGT